MPHSARRTGRAERANSTRLSLLWASVRDSLWFIPTVFTFGAFLLAVLVVRLDAGWNADGALGGILFSGGADGARGVLSAVAGSLITVTGVVFSVTVVALQLASSQFTPRVLRGFMADRANQLVLGIFIATFTYAVMVLRTVRSEDDAGPAFVPEVAVTLAIVLVVVSIGALIYFIDHAARSIQASVILARETAHTLLRIEHLFPRDIGEPEGAAAPDAPTAPGASILSDRSGYLLAVHAQALFELADERGLTIRMEPAIGAFVVPGETLAQVWPAREVTEERIEAIREAFLVGDERTPEQDVELGITVIADMAVRALSPGINDPTTAMLCIDRLLELLARLGTAPEPLAARIGPDGAVRFFARVTTFDRAVALAFDQIRHYGGGNPTVAKKLLDALGRLGALVRAPRHSVLVAQAELVRQQVRMATMTDEDRASVDHVAADVLASLRRRPSGDAAGDDSRSAAPRLSAGAVSR